MKDPLDLYVDNLREALKQYDYFLRLAILATLAFMVVSFSDPTVAPKTAPVSLSITSIQLSYRTVALLAIVGQFAFATLAAASLDAVARAVRYLQADQKLLAATCSYPSFATSPSNFVRRGSIVVAPICLLAWLASVGGDLAGSGVGVWAFVAGSFVFLVSPYLAMYWTVSQLPDVDFHQSTTAQTPPAQQ